MYDQAGMNGKDAMRGWRLRRQDTKQTEIVTTRRGWYIQFGGKAIWVYRARHHRGGCYQPADEYNSGVECACVSSTSQLSVGYEAEGWRAFGM